MDASWRTWSKEAEASLTLLVVLLLQDRAVSLEEAIFLCLRTWRLGGRCKDRVYRTDHADEFDVTNSGFFVNSSLALFFGSDAGSYPSVLS